KISGRIAEVGIATNPGSLQGHYTLRSKGVIASTSPYKNSYARLAPSLLNTPEEIETTLRHIRAIT
ncbi:MAG: hypothetical protein ACRERS_11605, partial [Methylococcales bacterium]